MKRRYFIDWYDRNWIWVMIANCFIVGVSCIFLHPLISLAVLTVSVLVNIVIGVCSHVSLENRYRDKQS